MEGAIVQYKVRLLNNQPTNERGEKTLKKAIESRSESATLLTFEQAQKRYQMNRSLLDKVAKECKAKIKIHRWVRLDARKLDAYFATLSETL